MRVVLLVTILSLIAVGPAIAARYEGIVVRASDSRPVGGVTVAAVLKPPWLALGPMPDKTVGRRITDRHGRFQFELPYSRSRLFFIVSSGTLIRPPRGAAAGFIDVGAVILERPRSDRLNVIRIGDSDIPRKARLSR